MRTLKLPSGNEIIIKDYEFDFEGSYYKAGKYHGAPEDCYPTECEIEYSVEGCQVSRYGESFSEVSKGSKLYEHIHAYLEGEAFDKFLDTV